MGHLSNQRRNGGGPRPRSNGSDTGPLRKVVGHCRVGYTTMEALECGHLQMPKSDLMGQTNAYRRRCRFCKAGRPTLFTGDPPDEVTRERYEQQYGKPADGK